MQVRTTNNLMQNNKNEILIALAKIIKKHRGKLSITQLSICADVSKSIWSMIEKGKRDVQLTTLFRISEALYMKPSELLKEIESELGDKFSSIEN